jgi:hypothetical protein
MLLRHVVRRALSFAPDKAGSKRAIKIAIMAITTSSSINVNPVNFKYVVLRGAVAALHDPTFAGRCACMGDKYGQVNFLAFTRLQNLAHKLTFSTQA